MHFFLLSAILMSPSSTTAFVDDVKNEEPAKASDQILDVSFGDIRIKYQPSPSPYPKEAREAGVSGNVSVVVIADTEGKVTSVKALSGPPLLHKAAEEHLAKFVLFPFLKDRVPRVIRFSAVVPFRMKK